MKIYPFSKVLLILLFSILLIAPVSAQTVAEDEELDTVEISFSGHISFDADGNVYIDDYFLAPAGAISPSQLSEGQYVEVTGLFLNDDTFQLTEIDTTVVESFESTDETTCDATGTTEDTADDCTGDDTGDETTCDATGTTEDTADDCTAEETGDETACDATGETEDTADDCTAEETCTPDGHPVAARIADAFDVDACEVEAMHDEGNGFGNIARAYLLAEAANQALMDSLEEGGVLLDEDMISPEDFIAMHDGGMGWGNILKSMSETYGVDVHPSDLAPGKLKKRAANDDDTDTSSETFSATSSNGNGNGNGKNKDKANKGNGKGNNGNNGNGNGKNKDKANNGNGNNGNGKGNNGNNGNGNGKDKGNKGKK